MEHAPFVHLHTHSEYSILDGSAKVSDLVARAAEYRMPALALTDHGNMFAAMEFYTAATRGGLKPIIGQEFYLSPTSLHGRDKNEKPYHLILLAGDEEGYRNLMKLSSIAYLEGFYYKPRIDMEALAAHAQGLICTSSCLGGEIASLLLREKDNEARERAGAYLDIFGKENYYLEVMDNGIPEQHQVNRSLVELGSALGIELVATNDVHYLDQHDAQYHDVLLCIQTGKMVSDTRRLRFKSDQFHLRSPQEMAALFSELPRALRNTIDITEKCNLLLETGKYHLPHFPIPEGFTADRFLRRLTEEGIARRYHPVTDQIRQRMEHELEVISSMGFSTYFLIVGDFIRFAKQAGIAVGPGRGSAAGSIVAYALEITDVDPLRYGLLFERFLNSSRISMPDIDIDFDGDRRDEVIRYVREKYGEDRVAQIITFGAMKARAAVRDVARVLEIPLSETDALAKMIPARPGMTIEEAVESNRDLRERIQNDQRVNRLFDISRRLEKLVRHPSTHAAGVVISPEPLDTVVPLYRDPRSGLVSTQYQMSNLEDVGLIKMDFLGLKNLTIIQRCLRSLERSGLQPPGMQELDLEDPAVYELLSKGRSMGVFQLESSGMQDLLRRMQPSRFDDVIAILALYRPGPLDSGMVDEFIERKQGRKPVTVPDPRLEPVLAETYGVIVYQEQVMEIARVIAGFSLAEADNLRKAMGKKKIEIIEEMNEQFIRGAEQNGVSKTAARDIFELMKTFGRYGFNKSHSTAYALLAFQTAYLKVHFPVHYLASLLSGELHDTDKICQYICETREMGIKVEAPDVNRSGVHFEVDGDSILYALAAVKNVGESAAASIVEMRRDGEYTSLFDFTARVDLRLINKRVMESLVKSGAMDSLGNNRRTLFDNLERALEYGASIQGDRLKGQTGLFEDLSDEDAGVDLLNIDDLDEWTEAEVSEYEREVLGFFFKAHPLIKYRQTAERFGVPGIRETAGASGRMTLFGIVSACKTITTKDGKPMAFVTLEDLTGSIEVVVFPSVYETARSCLLEKRVIVVRGRMDGEKLLADQVMYPEDLERESVSGIHLLVNGAMAEEGMLKLRDLLIKHRGKCTVYLHTRDLDKNRRMIRASEYLLVDPADDLFDQLKEEQLVERVWVR